MKGENEGTRQRQRYTRPVVPRKRTLFFLALGAAFAALVGRVLGVVAIALLNPGVKGALVTDDEMMAAFLGGAAAGGGLVLGGHSLAKKRRRPPWADVP